MLNGTNITIPPNQPSIQNRPLLPVTTFDYDLWAPYHSFQNWQLVAAFTAFRSFTTTSSTRFSKQLAARRPRPNNRAQKSVSRSSQNTIGSFTALGRMAASQNIFAQGTQTANFGRGGYN